MSEKSNYNVDHNLIGFYDDILEYRRNTSEYLLLYRKIKNTSLEDVEQEINSKEIAKQKFYEQLSRYNDRMETKWRKSKVEKPLALREAEEESNEPELFTIYELNIDDAIMLYKRLNKACEDLGITSLERMKRVEEGIGGKNYVNKQKDEGGVN